MDSSLRVALKIVELMVMALLIILIIVCRDMIVDLQVENQVLRDMLVDAEVNSMPCTHDRLIYAGVYYDWEELISEYESIDPVMSDTLRDIYESCQGE